MQNVKGKTAICFGGGNMWNFSVLSAQIAANLKIFYKLKSIKFLKRKITTKVRSSS